MSFVRNAATLAFLAGAGLLAGCADPTFGERLQAQGQELSEAGRNHDRGERLVRDGERELRSARSSESAALAKIEEGRELMRRAEAVAGAR